MKLSEAISLTDQAYIDTEWMISCIDDDLGEFSDFLTSLYEDRDYEMVLKDLAHTIAKMKRAEMSGAPAEELLDYRIRIGSVLSDSFANYAFEVCKRRVERNS